MPKNVAVNESIYSLKYGVGTVVDADSVRFSARFGAITKTFMRETLAEIGETRRTAYYADPVIVAPPKSAQEWAATKKLVIGVFDYAKTLKA